MALSDERKHILEVELCPLVVPVLDGLRRLELAVEGREHYASSCLLFYGILNHSFVKADAELDWLSVHRPHKHTRHKYIVYRAKSRPKYADPLDPLKFSLFLKIFFFFSWFPQFHNLIKLSERDPKSKKIPVVYTCSNSGGGRDWVVSENAFFLNSNVTSLLGELE